MMMMMMMNAVVDHRFGTTALACVVNFMFEIKCSYDYKYICLYVGTAFFHLVGYYAVLGGFESDVSRLLTSNAVHKHARTTPSYCQGNELETPLAQCGYRLRISSRTAPSWLVFCFSIQRSS
jgi:hypothetical protein